MRLPYQRSILVIAAFALASCASSLPTRAPVLETSQTPVQRSDGQLIVKILVPRRKHPVRVRVARGRRPRYVSASTAALKLTISRGTTVVSNQVVPLTTSSANCTKTTAGTACTAGIVLKACPTKAACYTAAVSTYDAVFCNGAPPVCSIPATANLLSTGQSVAFTVETGKANAVSLTLSGVPQSTVVTIDALTNAIGGTLELIGPGAHIFTVQ
ncbi:MAG TPA: hypothetical protein VK760_07270, partial [Candidatus Acidoferrales bacterium]|nr:hypothetical protein [Candidatus Acidoferrales bacterium]